MTEAEWLSSHDPEPMLKLLKPKASERKLRLFACACCRRIWAFVKDARSQTAVEVAEAHADGMIDIDDVRRVRGIACFADDGVPDELAYAAANAAFYAVFHRCAWVENAASQSVQTIVESALAAGSDYQVAEAAAELETAAQSDLLRDIFGNPFRPASISVNCQTPKIVGLAQTIYDERAFDRMPELADGLEKAGCTDAGVLEHCRGSGPHVRGCWVIDLVLGKE